VTSHPAVLAAAAAAVLDLTGVTVNGKGAQLVLGGAVTAATLTQTVDGASTVQFTCSDATRAVLRSPTLTQASRVTWSGLGYVLVSVEPGEGTTACTFEDDVIARLRQHSSLLVAAKATTTRAQFIERLCREAGVPCRVQPDERITPLPKAAGAPAVAGLPSGAGKLTAGQVASVAMAAGFTGDALLTAVAVSFAEDDDHDPGRLNSAGSGALGLWQVLPSAHPEYTLDQLRDPVQNAQAAFTISGSGSNWTPWETFTNGSYSAQLAAARQAIAGASPVGTTASGASAIPQESAAMYDSSDPTLLPFDVKKARKTRDHRGLAYQRGQWSRGTNRNRAEDSAKCITRLAAELRWRAFSDGTRLWVGSDAWIRARRGPRVHVRELTDGVGWVTGRWDLGSKTANDATFTTTGPWSGVPGQWAVTHDMGMLSGDWIVHTVLRDAAKPGVQVTLSRGIDDVAAPVDAAGVASGAGTAGPTGGTAPAAGSVQEKVVAFARAQAGKGYSQAQRLGPDTYDCSGLCVAAYASAGVSLPGSTTYGLWASPMASVPPGSEQPGDLLFGNDGENGVPGPGHVSLYVGGGQIVAAQNPAAGVQLTVASTNAPYLGARRP